MRLDPERLERLIFDLTSRLSTLEPARENEAVRHDLLVYPLLTLALGWNGSELLAQQSTAVPQEVKESYFWRGAVPNQRRPDLLIVPYGVSSKPVAIVEEKTQQRSMSALLGHSHQITEYQYLHNAVWGVITDGEKWILKRNLEIMLECASLQEFLHNYDRLYEYIGRDALLGRLQAYGTADLVIVRPSPHILAIASLFSHAPGPQAFLQFASEASPASLALLRYLTEALDEKALHPARRMGSAAAESWVAHAWRTMASILLGSAELLETSDPSETSQRKHLRSMFLLQWGQHGKRWETVYYWTDRYYDSGLDERAMMDALMHLTVDGELGDGLVESAELVGWFSESELGLLRNHELFSSLPNDVAKVIVGACAGKRTRM
jgi:hypothetical protein